MAATYNHGQRREERALPTLVALNLPSGPQHYTANSLIAEVAERFLFSTPLPASTSLHEATGHVPVPGPLDRNSGRSAPNGWLGFAPDFGAHRTCIAAMPSTAHTIHRGDLPPER